MRQPEARGKAWHVMVLHDNGCTPHVCVCKPDYLVEPLTGDNYLEGQRAQAKWMKESTS